MTIEVEGLPEGWRAVAYRPPVRSEKFYKDGNIRIAHVDLQWPELVIENDIEAVALNDAGRAVLDRFHEITGHETTHEMRRLVKPLLRVGIVKYINQVNESIKDK